MKIITKIKPLIMVTLLTLFNVGCSEVFEDLFDEEETAEDRRHNRDDENDRRNNDNEDQNDRNRRNDDNDNNPNDGPEFVNYFTEEQMTKANTAKDVDYLSENEKLLIYYCNLARLDGTAFVETYLSDLKNSTSSYEKSLVEDLQATKDVQMLFPNENLCKASKAHADDMNENDYFAHDSKDGTSCFTRVRKYYNGGAMAENISAGISDPLSIIRQLLIDQNTPSLGHRKNILSEKYCRIGVAIGKHPTWRSCCVQDFSDSSGD